MSRDSYHSRDALNVRLRSLTNYRGQVQVSPPDKVVQRGKGEEALQFLVPSALRA